MKRLFTFSALLSLAATMFAADDPTAVPTDNTFGLIKVESNLEQTLVAVPWCACGSGDEAIAVSNVVKTANLTVGDKLFVLKDSTGTFDGWELAEDASGVKYWAGVYQVISNDIAEKTGSASVLSAARGGAIILRRQNPTNETGAAKAFYLCGQLGKSAPVTQVVGGSAVTPAYTLLAPPVATNTPFNNLATWTGTISSNDVVSIVRDGQSSLDLKWSSQSGTWQYYGLISQRPRKRGWLDYKEEFCAGRGFWYISRGGNPQVNWSLP